MDDRQMVHRIEIIILKNLQKLQFLSATISVNSSLLLPNLRTTPTTPSKENKPVKSEDSLSMNEDKKSWISKAWKI